MSTLPIQPRPMLPESIWSSQMTDQNGLVNPVGAWGQQLQFLALAQGALLGAKGTHAQRQVTQAASYPEFSLYLETDRKLLYIAIGGQWVYLAGILAVSQGDLPPAGDLAANDLNLRVFVTDFAHELNWTGTQWQWAPADAGSGFIMPFQNPPNPGLGWQLCDGSGNVPNLNGDGSLSFTNLPNTPGSYYRQ